LTTAFPKAGEWHIQFRKAVIDPNVALTTNYFKHNRFYISRPVTLSNYDILFTRPCPIMSEQLSLNMWIPIEEAWPYKVHLKIREEYMKDTLKAMYGESP
jgi:hypothetical protein